jgi:hypothetical protein
LLELKIVLDSFAWFLCSAKIDQRPTIFEVLSTVHHKP